ncbi:hypothetical protein OKW38_007092 [Paraburkholderia sp. MM5496-R1]|uniref:hypothetical protein n=1 Tax=unclassified Paraburkholderia TaxID=2615204 RepID=UPI003D230371
MARTTSRNVVPSFWLCIPEGIAEHTPVYWTGRCLPSRSPSRQQLPTPVFGTVWIIDDDESSRLASETLVQSIGYSGMSGLELLDRLVVLGAAPPTIFVSAFPSDGCICGGKASPAVALLDKPVNAIALKRELANIRI